MYTDDVPVFVAYSSRALDSLRNVVIIRGWSIGTRYNRYTPTRTYRNGVRKNDAIKIRKNQIVYASENDVEQMSMQDTFGVFRPTYRIVATGEHLTVDCGSVKWYNSFDFESDALLS